MCARDTSLEALVLESIAGTDVVLSGNVKVGMSVSPSSASGVGTSRRRRLWELNGHAHCPVVGVCMPMPVLRRLVDKVLGGRAVANDYELHCGVVSDAKHRNRLSAAIQKELDKSHAAALWQSQKIKSTQALQDWWQEAAQANLSAALWAVLTHPCCTVELETLVLGCVHMAQHQAGALSRVDRQQLEALLKENAVLARSLADAQKRNTSQSQQHAQKAEALQMELLRVRADLIGRETAVATLQDTMKHMEAVVPQLKSRMELSRQVAAQIERAHQLERTLFQLQQEVSQLQCRVQELTAQPSAASTSETQGLPIDADEMAPEAMSSLGDRTVLCVGGRPAVVPIYKQLIEKMGGRFLHHDGGEEESAARLDTALAAADLVICQTGCISHNAYWRAKNHCKRTGKECVYIDNPSAHAMAKGLAQVVVHKRPEHAGGKSGR